MTVRLFSLGRVVMTASVHAMMREDLTFSERVQSCLVRHVSGDHGVISEDDRRRNERTRAGDAGGYHYASSAYPLDDSKPCAGHGENTLWIITEGYAGEIRTTILLPEEY